MQVSYRYADPDRDGHVTVLLGEADLIRVVMEYGGVDATVAAQACLSIGTEDCYEILLNVAKYLTTGADHFLIPLRTLILEHID